MPSAVDTVVLCLQELIAREGLPVDDSESGVFSLLLIVDDEENERMQSYDQLFEYLEHEHSSRGVALERLNIFLSGSSATIDTTEVLGHVSVTPLGGKEELLCSAEDLQHFSMAVISHPLWTNEAKLSQWTPLMRWLVERNVTTVVTAKAFSPLVFHLSTTDESVHQLESAAYWQGACAQEVLENYFGANIVISSTVNALAISAFSRKEMGHFVASLVKKHLDLSNASFCIFQGKQMCPPPVSAVDCIRSQQLLYLSYVGLSARLIEGNSALEQTAEAILQQIKNGLLAVSRDWSLEKLENYVREECKESLLPKFMRKQRARQKQKLATQK